MADSFTQSYTFRVFLVGYIKEKGVHLRGNAYNKRIELTCADIRSEVIESAVQSVIHRLRKFIIVEKLHIKHLN